MEVVRVFSGLIERWSTSERLTVDAVKAVQYPAI